MLPAYVLPGQSIPAEAEGSRFEPGAGVERAGAGLRSTLLGELHLEPVPGLKQTFTLSVTNKFTNPFSLEKSGVPKNSRRSSSRLPRVGDVVFARVMRLSPAQVHLEILVVENGGASLADSGVGWSANAVGTVHQTSGRLGDLAELGEGYGALIRSQDIRATERDKVRVEDHFHPGDIVRANVLSLGDGSNFYLTTIHNDLGVVFAKSRWGYNMVALDWQTMMAPESGETESRKCANPFL